jgi:potassium-transporting ATPase KdpC subunit
MNIKAQMRPTLVLLVCFTAITGLLYPALVTGIARVAFPRQAAGSLIVRDGRVIGSTLIGQPFSDPKYFWSRPSATSPVPYNGASSAGSNLGPLNPALVTAVRDRAQTLRASAAPPQDTVRIPIDLVTSSGSGLDPHISPEGATYQVERVARLRGLSRDSVATLVVRFTEGRPLGVFGEPRVNVLLLNLALDSITAGRQ